jgi:hypothetical protein
MATRTISNGGGNWDSTATWGGAAVPTASDDVVATGTSGNVTVNTTARCRSINLTNYVGTLTQDSGQDIHVGTTTAGPSNVALKFVSGMTYTPGVNATLNFVTSSGTQQTIDMGGKTAARMNFESTGGSYLFASHAVITTTLFVTSGTVNAGGFNITAESITSGGSSLVLTMGSGTWTLTGASGAVWSVTSSSTINANTSTIIISNTGSGDKTFSGGGKTFNNLQIATGGAGVVTFSGNNTFAKLSATGSSTKTIKFTAGSTTTLTGSSDAFFSGTSGNLITILSSSDDSAWNLSKSSGTVSCDYLSLRDSVASGGATFNAGYNSTSVSGNSGWLFPEIFTETPTGGAETAGVADESFIPIDDSEVIIVPTNAIGGLKYLKGVHHDLRGEFFVNLARIGL